jgi:N-carbamoyl-L-amino-acid hydrolase
MRECGFDDVSTDAVGNVVGIYRGSDPGTKALLTGSHFDTVRNAGKYDGRLGILVPMLSVRELHRAGRRLPFAVEVVAFAEEEGQRFKAASSRRPRSSAIRPGWLDQRDADGITCARRCGPPACRPAWTRSRRCAATPRGTSASSRCTSSRAVLKRARPAARRRHLHQRQRALLGEVRGMASHAGRRRWPAGAMPPPPCRAGRLSREARRRAPNLVGTMGMLDVPGGSINVVPGAAASARHPRHHGRGARRLRDVLAELQAICRRRGVSAAVEETMRVAAAPCGAAVAARWERAVAAAVPAVHRCPAAPPRRDELADASAAGHAVRARRERGISHNPLEIDTPRHDSPSGFEPCGARLRRGRGTTSATATRGQAMRASSAPARRARRSRQRRSRRAYVHRPGIDAHFDDE